MRLGRTGGQADGRTMKPLTAVSALYCQRCNFIVPAGAMGCKNPCPNCGTVYPLGDCSD